MPSFSTIAYPLNQLLRDNVIWKWGLEEQDAFDRLKAEIATEGRALLHFDLNSFYLAH